MNQTIEWLKRENDAQKNSMFFETGRSLIELCEGRFKPLIQRFGKPCGEICREAIAQTVPDPSKSDGKIHALCDALLAAEGRLGP